MNERLYSFQNMYFAGIHAGIQTGHTIARMSQKYALTEGFCNLSEEYDLEAGELFSNWAMRDGGETIIVKNGGMAGHLLEIVDFFKANETELRLPWDFFNESQFAANGALTNVSVVVPKWLWSTADSFRYNKPDSYYFVSFGDDDVHYLMTEDYRPLELNYVQKQAFDDFVYEKKTLPCVREDVFGKTRWITLNSAQRELIKIMNSKGLM